MRKRSRPAWLPHEVDADIIALYDWMLANNVDEWLPERFGIVVHGAAAHGGTLTYQSFKWRRTWWGRTRRGWDADQIRLRGIESRTVERTVPLLSPVTEQIREICFRHGHQLIEHPVTPLWPKGEDEWT